MITQTKAKIFLADERGHNEITWFRSYNTFNFGNYRNENKMPFGSLYILNDDTLAAGKKLSLAVQENSFLVLIPVVGAVEYSDNHNNTNAVQAGEALLCNLQKDTSFTIANPFENETVNFLQLWLKQNNLPSNKTQHVSFDINSNNQLVNIFETISIGKYNGRTDGVYKMKNISSGIFTFVIEGAFEVQNRLLHARDGLALWNVGEIEFEALSNEAIILFIECEV